jgi:nucleotide-binding universal stress UspA family protein
MKKILVGVDGSEASLEAMDWAVTQARVTGAEIVAVNSFVPVQSEIRPSYFARLREEQAALLEEWATGRLDGVEHHLEVADGDPRDALPRAVAAHDADLLVVASTGTSGRGPGFLHVGSVVEYLAHHLERPLAVIPPGSGGEISRIVVAVDGSSHSRTAVLWAAGLAGPTGAGVTAVAVEEPKSPIGAAEDPATWQTAAEHVVAADWAAPLAELGDRFRPVVTQELPVADAILRVATDERADLVVVGARGVGGISGLRVGGVALAVLHRTQRPIVLVPDP